MTDWQKPDDAARSMPPKSSGVYLIGEKSGEVVYVGESHTGSLRRTMLRHFQKWKGPTAGPTYARREHRARFIKTSADNAILIQNELIEELRPRDNTAGKPQWWEFWK